jgi:hypothetical protein
MWWFEIVYVFNANKMTFETAETSEPTNIKTVSWLDYMYLQYRNQDPWDNIFDKLNVVLTMHQLDKEK